MSKQFTDYQKKLSKLKPHKTDFIVHTLKEKEYEGSFTNVFDVLKNLETPADCDLTELIRYEEWLKEQ